MTIRLRSRASLVFLALFALVVVLHQSALAQTPTVTTLYTFPGTSYPIIYGPLVSGLVQGSDGNFYGTTVYGGAYDEGSVFKITPAGDATVLYSFCSIESDDICRDGAEPNAALAQGSDGNFYGTTTVGGYGYQEYGLCDGCGTVFRITPSGTLTTLHSFCVSGPPYDECPDGADPWAGLVQGSDGNLYGTTSQGGATLSGGTFFSISLSGTLVTLASFSADGNEGEYPIATLIQGSDDNYYGTTYDTVYNVTSVGAVTTLANMDGTGSYGTDYPYAGLVEGGNDIFYGTTIYGGNVGSAACGKTGCSFIYGITSAGTLTTLYTFCSTENCSDGNQIYSGLVVGSDGNFYGTTYGYGQYDAGTIFKMSPAGSLTTLYAFTGGTDSGLPGSALLQASDGNFYATTSGYFEDGTRHDDGTVYKLSLSPALAGPVQLTLSNSSVDAGTAVTLAWRVTNAFSLSLQQCYAFVQGGYAAAGTWTGLQTGTLSDGVYSGSAQVTPTDGGVYTYALTCGGVESGFATLTVSGGTLAVTTSSLPNDVVGTPYSQTLVAQGGTPPYKWSISSGSLPAGLSLTATTGVISGTPTSPSTSNFVVKVTDSESTPATATASLSIMTTLYVETTSLPSATVNTAYSTTLAAGGGTAPYTWSISSGTLPAGLSLNASTGVISGAPTTAATSSFTVEVVDSASHSATANLSINVAAALEITTTSLPDAIVGVSYAQTLTATGGTPPYTWSVSSGSLPSGLSLNASTGAISGTATAVGNNAFTVEIADSASRTSSANLSILDVAPLVVTSTTLPSGTAGTAYSVTMQAGGGVPPYTWSLNAGSLPAGLSLASATGVISGTPTSAATSSFTIMVVDNNSYAATANLTITINPATPEIVTTVLGTGDVGTALSTTLSAVGGVPPYAWSVSAGTLPAGLTLSSSTGVLSGTPTTAATTSFTVEVKDSANNTTTQALSMTIYGSTIVRVTTTSLAPGTVGTAYSQTLAAYSGTKPYTWSIGSGTLPAGLSLNASTGVISGTPTAAGTAPFLIHVKGSGNNTAGANLSIAINPTLTVLTTVLPTAAVGTSYSFTAAASGGVGSYTWSVSSGALPAGLTLNATTGVISGKPTTAETSSFTLKATDSDGNVATSRLSITVYGTTIVRITTTSLASGTVGTAYSATMQATSGTKPYTWSVYSGSLPAGLTINSSTGVISGTPTVVGTSSFFVAVKGAGANTATAILSIAVAQ